MIKERYVNPEVARLLRDKGFNEECYTYYDSNDTIDRFEEGFCFNNTSYPWGLSYDVNEAENYVVAPTQQTAIDWMRTKDVLITYDLAPIGTNLMVKVYKRTQDPDFPWTEGITIIRSTLEEAININEALKYALEKLL